MFLPDRTGVPAAESPSDYEFPCMAALVSDLLTAVIELGMIIRHRRINAEPRRIPESLPEF